MPMTTGSCFDQLRETLENQVLLCENSAVISGQERLMDGKQLGSSDYEQSTAKKRTKREKFLAEMEQVVPW